MAATRPPRRLFLHLSALSDSEYAVYIDALRDLLDDEDPDRRASNIPDEELERRSVGLREVRAWMKGRFRDIGTAEIDKVLLLFTPQLSQKEMSGGQLLAALRLLMHARHGGEIGEGNVFVQAEPSSPTLSRSMTLPTSTSKPSDHELPAPDLPVLLESSPKLPRTNPFLQDFEPPKHDFSTSASLPHLHTDMHSAPGFVSAEGEVPSPRRASLSSAPPRPPVSSKPRVEGVGVPPGTTNPFLHRAKTHTGTSQIDRTPPLPPRKPSHMSKPSAALVPPPLPAKPHGIAANKPPHPSHPMKSSSSTALNQVNSHGVPQHLITPLMQQSLLASREGAFLKRAKDEAERTRVLEVIRSSSGKSGRTASTSRSPDKGVRRPVPKPPPRMLPPSSSAGSSRSDVSEPRTAFSLEEVAAARLGKLSRSPFERSYSPSRSPPESPGQDLPDNNSESPSVSKSASMVDHFVAPPTHPARRPSARAPSTPSRMHKRAPSYHSYQSSTVPQSPFSASNGAISPKTAPAQSTAVSPVSPSYTSRSTRSQSMHQPSSPNPLSDTESRKSGRQSPPLPPPRRRPESMQFSASSRAVSSPTPADTNINSATTDLGSPFGNSFGTTLEKRAAIFNDSSEHSSFRANGHTHHNRREKESPSRERANAFASLQRTFSALSDRVQPTLARARYKAEANLAPRRGFVPNGQGELEVFHPLARESADRLMEGEDSEDGGSPGLDPDYYLGDEDDGGRGRADEIGGLRRDSRKTGGAASTTWDEDEETVRGRGRGLAPGRLAQFRDRDNLKLPEGEGWAPLS